MQDLTAVRLINADTLASLQIIQDNIHPLSHNAGPKKHSSSMKEGLSIYGLFSRLARTPQGKYLLRQTFLRPSMNMNTIRNQLNTINVFLRPDNDGSFRNIVKHLGQIKDMKITMIQLGKGVSMGPSKGEIRSGIWSSLRSVRLNTIVA